MAVPKQRKIGKSNITPNNVVDVFETDRMSFSFEKVELNKYFNIDATCPSWPKDLFDTLQKASTISLKDIYDGKYSGDTSPFRVHRHKNAEPPCPIPEDIDLKEFWQVRISKTKGGIHGTLIDNIFYVVWFDPHHNLYPDEDFGGNFKGLKKIRHPAESCCKDRDLELAELQEKNERLAAENAILKEWFNEQTKTN